MSKYIALLRGINVGGHNKVPMAQLRDALTKAGLEDVQTYIQSGNIGFVKQEQAPEGLEKTIHDMIHDAFGISIAVW